VRSCDVGVCSPMVWRFFSRRTFICRYCIAVSYAVILSTFVSLLSSTPKIRQLLVDPGSLAELTFVTHNQQANASNLMKHLKANHSDNTGLSNLKVNKIMFKERDVCPVPSLTLKRYFHIRYIWMTLTFSITQSRNSTCISMQTYLR